MAFSIAAQAQQEDKETVVDSLEKVSQAILPAQKGKFFNSLSKTFGMQDFTIDEKPKIAFRRSLILPGWGQITNNQSWLAPIIWLAAAGDYMFGIRQNNLRYKLYLGHYAKATYLSRSLIFDQDGAALPTTTPIYLQLKPKEKSQIFDIDRSVFYLMTSDSTFATVTPTCSDCSQKDLKAIEQFQLNKVFSEEEAANLDLRGPYNTTTFENAKNQYRRYKQLSMILLGAGWLMQALQANVAAHLQTFDMSDDLSFSIRPAGPATFGTQANGLSLSIVFK
ncbi:DUF5683 domain-containing protein [Marinilongibacter aquaticus]|uniref:DUF5683 domain-containing protein n=1 Tax=Marinilongibacter aquaticus TaxID=2975157 RepID=UPI0021BDC174|nr:DUF5683 domain-containing protein [Marinilongibacter aquaticus]UBM59336.1 DUF5683 domain-containing protein [Marinilongibacter aquaticus]